MRHLYREATIVPPEFGQCQRRGAREFEEFREGNSEADGALLKFEEVGEVDPPVASHGSKTVDNWRSEELRDEVFSFSCSKLITETRRLPLQWVARGAHEIAQDRDVGSVSADAPGVHGKSKTLGEIEVHARVVQL